MGFYYGVVETIVKRIISEFEPEKVILFGSVASHTADEYSDVDLLVVMDTNRESFYRSIPIDIALRDITIDKDIIVMTPEEFEKRKDDGYSFVNEIVRTGHIIYDKSKKSPWEYT